VEIVLRGQHFTLLPQRAVYWQEEQALILSDLHIGKSMHFRRAGIAIPKQVFDDDLNTLNNLLHQFTPTQLLIVGDMFHSRHNNEVTLFHLWRMQYPGLKIMLIKGNHDILPPSAYTELDIEVVKKYTTDVFLFTHDKCDAHTDKFCFSGHLHPGIRVEDNARQSLKFPCFHFTANSCTLPAFSKFTGLALVKPGIGDKVYAIADTEIVNIPL
jgi:uncharacterized protein